MRRRLAALFAVFVWLAAALPNGAFAQDGGAFAQDGGSVSVDLSAGYARLLFEFAEPAEVGAAAADGVLMIRSSRPPATSVDELVAALGPYVNSGRRDGAGTYYFALAGPVAIHSSSQGTRTAIDLVPASYRGVPPDLEPPPPPPEPPPEQQGAQQEPEAQEIDIATLPLVPVRAGEHSDFSRLVFDWPDEVPYTAYPGRGQISVRFEAPARPDFAVLDNRTPAWVRSAGWHLDGRALVVDFTTDPESRFNVFRSGARIVVDVLAPLTDAAAYQALQAPGAAVTLPGGDEIAAGQIAAGQIAAGQIIVGGDAPANAGTPVPQPDNGAAPAAPAEPPPLSRSVENTPETEPEAETNSFASQLPPRAELTRDGIAFHFPAARGHAVAVFARGPATWIVLEDHPELDPVALLSGISEIIDQAEAGRAEGAAILRLVFETPLAAHIAENNISLDVVFSAENPVPPAPITLTREGANGISTLKTTLAGATRVIELDDAGAGDRLYAVPARPGKAMLTAKQYIELEALPSAAGLVVRPRADDLRIGVANEAVTLSRPVGLTLSLATGAQPQPVVATPVSANGPAFMDFARWKRGESPDVLANVRALRTAAAALPESGANTARLRLAQYFIAHELAAEALGVIAIMQGNDPGEENNPALQVMRGAASYMMGRYIDARLALSPIALDGDPHAALWRGLTEAKLGNWTSARRDLLTADGVLRLYPAVWQGRAFLARAEAGLALADLSTANDALDQLPAGISRSQELEARLFKARLLAAQNHIGEATAQLIALEHADYAPVAAQAIWARVELQLAGEEIGREEAIDTLERLRFRWRGDRLELNTLRKLGGLYFEDERWREGLDALRSAALNFSGSDLAREAQDEMRNAFAALFIEGKADAMGPVQALSLFYDFIELTPIGREGDDMIRRLSDRLVTVDLLGPAAELLSHQVNARLNGVARAAVATRLANIYLLDQKPRQALQTINDTRQTGLSESLTSERRILEARALAALEQYGAAIDLIADDSSAAADSLRSEIHWQAGDWTQAGAGTENMLGARWQADRPLNESERLSVMRAGVAYTLAGDGSALERLRTRYGAMMAASIDGAGFEMLTQQVDRQGVPLRDLARRIASVENLQAFMAEYRRRAAGDGALAANN